MTSAYKLKLTMFALWCSYAFFFMEGKNQTNKRYQDIKDPADRVKYFLKVTPFEGTWEIDNSFYEKPIAKSDNTKNKSKSTRQKAKNQEVNGKVKTLDVNNESKIELSNKMGRIKFFIVKDNDLTFSMTKDNNIKFEKSWMMEMLMIDGKTLNDNMFKVDIMSGELDQKTNQFTFNDKYDLEKNKELHEQNSGPFPSLVKITTTSNGTINKTNQSDFKFQNFLRVMDYRKEPSVITKYVKRKIVKQFNCSMIGELNFKIDPEALVDKTKDLTKEISGSFKIYPKKNGLHKNCGVPIKGEQRLFTKDFYNKISRYSLYMIAIAMINITISVTLIEKIYHGHSDPHRYSMFSQLMIASFDVYTGAELIMKSFHSGTVFHFFFTPAQWFFILYSALDYRIIFYIWFKNNETAQNQLPQEEYRARLQSFSCNFGLYTFMIYLAISSQNEYTIGPMITCAMILTPQIVLQARKGFQLEADYQYLIVYCFSRYLFDFYFMGCPDNFEEINLNYVCIAGVVIIAFIQILVMKLQDEYGADWFVPNFMLPVKFNYFQKLDRSSIEKKQNSDNNVTIDSPTNTDQSMELDSGLFSVSNNSLNTSTELTKDVEITKELDDSNTNEDIDYGDDRICAICMCSVYCDAECPFDEKIKDKRFVLRLTKMKGKIMKTPCGHEFHIPCLVNWMQIKMECPSCRKEQPAI